MARAFQFRLQKLLELRRLSEQESARQVGMAQREAEAARVAIDSLDQVRRASAEDLGAAHAAPRSAGELQRVQLLLAQLDEHIAQASETLTSAEQHVAVRVQEYHSAARGRNVLDRLRDRHLELWRSALLHTEQKELDEIAVRRHRLQHPGIAEAGA